MALPNSGYNSCYGHYDTDDRKRELLDCVDNSLNVVDTWEHGLGVREDAPVFNIPPKE